MPWIQPVESIPHSSRANSHRAKTFRSEVTPAFSVRKVRVETVRSAGAGSLFGHSTPC